jgi:hypothetical protein
MELTGLYILATLSPISIWQSLEPTSVSTVSAISSSIPTTMPLANLRQLSLPTPDDILDVLRRIANVCESLTRLSVTTLAPAGTDVLRLVFARWHLIDFKLEAWLEYNFEDIFSALSEAGTERLSRLQRMEIP